MSKTFWKPSAIISIECKKYLKSKVAFKMVWWGLNMIISGWRKKTISLPIFASKQCQGLSRQEHTLFTPFTKRLKLTFWKKRLKVENNFILNSCDFTLSRIEIGTAFRWGGAEKVIRCVHEILHPAKLDQNFADLLTNVASSLVSQPLRCPGTYTPQQERSKKSRNGKETAFITFNL